MSNRKTDKKQKAGKTKRIIIILFVLSPILFVIFNILKWPIYNSLLDNYGVKTEAIIINEKNIIGKGIITQQFSYSYEFYANKKYYKGDSKNKKYKIGNKLEVEYLKSFPEIHRVSKIGN